MLYGSQSLRDDEFLHAVEACQYPAGDFHHADHLRVGWILLSRMPLEAALKQAAWMIRGFAEHHGSGERYHATMTRGWMLLLASHREADFNRFMEQNEERISPKLLHRYWREETLNAPEARKIWVEPDLHPLPQLWPRALAD